MTTLTVKDEQGRIATVITFDAEKPAEYTPVGDGPDDQVLGQWLDFFSKHGFPQIQGRVFRSKGNESKAGVTTTVPFNEDLAAAVILRLENMGFTVEVKSDQADEDKE
jgi:hypothetical protein